MFGAEINSNISPLPDCALRYQKLGNGVDKWNKSSIFQRVV
jgi:hypothetical protein